MTIYRNILSAPRWAGAQTLVRDIAWEYGLKLNIEVDKGWIRETVRFSVEGEEAAIRAFRNVLSVAVEDYQKRTESV